MAYEINISKAVQNEDGTIKMDYKNEPTYVHYFATAERSIDSITKLKQILDDLRLIYTTPLFNITATSWSKVGESINID
jgi:hypothetical protein